MIFLFATENTENLESIIMKVMKNVTLRFIKQLSLLMLIVSLNGCFLPSFTHSRSVVSIEVDQGNISPSDENTSKRFIVISFWEYPKVNNSRGKIVINEVILTEKQQISVDFPFKGYWVVWTPALGTQHLAPEPGIMLFYENYPLRWSMGIPSRICCEKPLSEHGFKFEFNNLEENILLKEIESPSLKLFFEDFLSEKECLIKKVDKCKDITDEEKIMIFEKFEQIESMLNI